MFKLLFVGALVLYLFGGSAVTAYETAPVHVFGMSGHDRVLACYGRGMQTQDHGDVVAMAPDALHGLSDSMMSTCQRRESNGLLTDSGRASRGLLFAAVVGFSGLIAVLAVVAFLMP